MNNPNTSLINNSKHLSFEELLNKFYAQDNVVEGNIIKVNILSLQKDYIIVDTNYKCEGLVPLKEFATVDGIPQIKVGDCVEALIEERENDLGWMILSKDKADRVKTWDDIELASNKEELIEGIIIGKVKGGLQVDIGVKAFLPGSQIDLRPVRDLDALIGEKFQFRVIKFNKKRGNIVLSRRLVLEKERASKRKLTLEQLQEGAILEGVVKNLTDYGAFVDLGGVDGLLHVTDMSWGRVQKPSDVFQYGDTIKVKILKYDLETERVSLGIKQIQEDPWINAPEEFVIGRKVVGKVVSLTDYGVFIELKPGIEGLIHISEMSWNKRVRHPSKMVNIGDTVIAVVLDIDPSTKRISLGMKQTQPNPWVSLEKRYPIGTVIRGKIRNITDFGIFIHIEDGVDGLVHISDLSWTHRVKHPSEIFQKTDEVEAVVLNIDADNRRFSLGIKQLNEDPWDKIASNYPRGSKVKGIVKKITDFGAFIEIEPGVDGLCHISEFSQNRVNNPRDFLATGESIEVMIIDIDPKVRRIGLSLKALQKDVDNDVLDQDNNDTDNHIEEEKKDDSSINVLRDAIKNKLNIKD